jgi:hypothetical protein
MHRSMRRQNPVRNLVTPSLSIAGNVAIEEGSFRRALHDSQKDKSL